MVESVCEIKEAVVIKGGMRNVEVAIGGFDGPRVVIDSTRGELLQAMDNVMVKVFTPNNVEFIDRID